MIAIAHHLLASAPAKTPVASLAELATRIAPLAFSSTVDRAVAAGFAADRLGYAFAGGYRAALARLVPQVKGAACLCATEQGGGHPRFLRTSLAQVDGGYRLTGTKTWVTLGSTADELLVVASVGHDDAGKNRLKVVHLPASRAGIAIVDKAPTPFAPEIPHAEATFDAVAVQPAEILDGDGYDAYLKPFRTIEDAHVLASALGYLVSVARAYAWPRVHVEEALPIVLALREIGAADPSRREVHIALAGAFRQARALFTSCEPCWSSAPEDERARWQRDRPLLDVAEKVRALRLDAAWGDVKNV